MPAGAATSAHSTDARYIDGVNNLDYWTGKSSDSARGNFLDHYEGKLSAIRMGPWKFLFLDQGGHYANLVSRTAPIVFNIRPLRFPSVLF